jgi:hypothetical protein
LHSNRSLKATRLLAYAFEPEALLMIGRRKQT